MLTNDFPEDEPVEDILRTWKMATLATIEIPQPAIKHGTPSGYMKCNPRCDECKKWRREYVRKYRSNMAGNTRTYNRLYAQAMRILKRNNRDEFLSILHDLQEQK